MDLFKDEGRAAVDGRKFEPRDLLAAVDLVDDLRGYLNNAGTDGEQPMRTVLLDLHEHARETYPAGSREDLIKLYEDVDDLASTAFQLMDHAEKLYNILQSLHNTEPEDLGA